MESSKLLKETFKERGVKAVSQQLNLSPSLLYRWCQDKSSSTSPGAENPLDRIQTIVSFTDNKKPVHWLCNRAGGFFVENPQVNREDPLSVLVSTQKLLEEFSEVLSVISKNYQNDDSIDFEEAESIRKEWEDLKCLAETFVTACEHGAYSKQCEGDKSDV